MSKTSIASILDPESGIRYPLIAGGDGNDPPAGGGANPPAEPDGGDTDPDAGGDPAGEEGGKPKERTVPLSALVNERTKLNTQIRTQQETISKLEKAAQAAKASDPGDLSEEDVARKKWHKFLGIDEIKEALREAKEGLAELKTIKEQATAANQTLKAQQDSLAEEAEEVGNTAWDKNLGMTKEEWGGFVASQMKPAEIARIYSGDRTVMPKIIERCKKFLKPGQDSQKQREAERLRSLPKTPAAGGNPPSPPAEVKVTGRALHLRAGARIQEIMARNAEGG